MTQREVLYLIKNLVRQRCVAIEKEKVEHPQDISTLRLMDADLCTILDSVEDAISSWQDLPGLSFDEAQEQAMREDSSDGPVADSDEGYTLRRVDEPGAFASCSACDGRGEVLFNRTGPTICPRCDGTGTELVAGHIGGYGILPGEEADG